MIKKKNCSFSATVARWDFAPHMSSDQSFLKRCLMYNESVQARKEDETPATMNSKQGTEVFFGRI